MTVVRSSHKTMFSEKVILQARSQPMASPQGCFRSSKWPQACSTFSILHIVGLGVSEDACLWKRAAYGSLCTRLSHEGEDSSSRSDCSYDRCSSGSTSNLGEQDPMSRLFRQTHCTLRANTVTQTVIQLAVSVGFFRRSLHLSVSPGVG